MLLGISLGITSYLLAFCEYNLNLYDSNPYFCIAGDFNRFDFNQFLHSFNIHNIVDKPTCGEAILDLILLDNRLQGNSTVNYHSPVASSDHKVLFLEGNISPHNSYQINKAFHYVYDLRESHISKLLSAVKVS